MGEKILSQLEKLAFFLQRRYMASRRTIEIVEKGRVLFHPRDCSANIMLEYKRKLKELKLNG